MDLNWLAPAYDDAKTPLDVSDVWIKKVAIAMSAYILFIIYPAYAGLRYYYSGNEPTWFGLGIASGSAILFGVFAFQTMSRYFHLHKKR